MRTLSINELENVSGGDALDYLKSWEQIKADMKYVKKELSDMHSSAAGTAGSTAILFADSMFNTGVLVWALGELAWAGGEKVYEMVQQTEQYRELQAWIAIMQMMTQSLGK
jgi:bacteriocin-like protein